MNGVSYTRVVDGVQVGLGNNGRVIWASDWSTLWKLFEKGHPNLKLIRGGPETMGHADLVYSERNPMRRGRLVAAKRYPYTRAGVSQAKSDIRRLSKQFPGIKWMLASRENPASLGSGGRSKACVQKVSRRPEVGDPRALCAWIGRKKYGKQRFQKLAAQGRRWR